jgi:hypothetical protein
MIPLAVIDVNADDGREGPFGQESEFLLRSSTSAL